MAKTVAHGVYDGCAARNCGVGGNLKKTPVVEADISGDVPAIQNDVLALTQS